MNNVYKVLNVDVDVIHLGKHDGSLLSLEKKYFNFLPVVGEKVEVYTNDDNYFVRRNYSASVQEPIPTVQKSSKSKIRAGLLALFLGGYGAHDFYLGRQEFAWVRLAIGIFSTLLSLLGEYGTLAGIIYFLNIINLFWVAIEGVLILTSKTGSRWHQDSEGRELLD
ncbi:TPA: TM2 domain-containing protein [Streptococcus suis]|nr:TM2 domain-containing protein [Streptococcus suis]